LATLFLTESLEDELAKERLIAFVLLCCQSLELVESLLLQANDDGSGSRPRRQDTIRNGLEPRQ